jgi:hypothetical protein
MEDGDRTMEGSITHYVSLWSNAPIVDLEEVVDYQATRLEAQWYYSGQIPVGKDLDEHDCLIVPLAGAAQVVPVKETREHRLAHPWRGLYSTDNPEEGWFAWQDPNEKTGLATFYEKMDRIEFRQAWVTYRPALHPSVSIRTTPYTAPEVNLFFRDRALRCRSRYTRELRYTALREEQPEDLRRLYHLWARPLDQAARVAWPEGK